MTSLKPTRTLRLEIDAAFFICACAAVVVTGLAKGGFAGLGALAMPVMVIGVSPLRAAAILLPILILQDVVGVASFRRTWDSRVLSVVLPGMAAGVALGYVYAARVSEIAVLAMVGAISMLFGIRGLWREFSQTSIMQSNSPLILGIFFGAASGFSSQIAHAGSPPFHMWLLPQRLERDTFVGTSAIAFAFMNFIKVPAYAALGQFTVTNLIASAMLVPVALLSTVAGVKLVRRTDPARYYKLIYGLMILLGAKLLSDAI